MSVIGKSGISFKKGNVPEQSLPNVGVKTLAFAHEFLSDGENAILFNSLNMPNAWQESGLLNPSSQTIQSANLQLFAKNITVSSSIRGLVQKSEYIVKNSGIFFKNINSFQNEIFEVYASDFLIAGSTMVDARRIRVEGELSNTETDFVIGYEVDVLNEEVIVFRDGIQMFRSDNNDDSGLTGNYYYVVVGGSRKSNIIRFFSPSVGSEAIFVSSIGNIVDQPNVSTFQQIENLAGQLDAVIPTVATLAGVPESNFRIAPNNVDLRNFGDKLIKILEIDVPKIEKQSYRLSQAGSALLNRSGQAQFNLGTATIVNDGDILITPQDDAPNNRTIFQAVKECTVVLAWSANIETTTNNLVVFKDGVGHQFGKLASNANWMSVVPDSIGLKAGETFSVGSSANISNNANATTLTFTVKAITTQKIKDLI